MQVNGKTPSRETERAEDSEMGTQTLPCIRVSPVSCGPCSMGLLNFFFFKCEGESPFLSHRTSAPWCRPRVSDLVLSLMNQRARSGKDTHILFLFGFWFSGAGHDGAFL